MRVQKGASLYFGTKGPFSMEGGGGEGRRQKKGGKRRTEQSLSLSLSEKSSFLPSVPLLLGATKGISPRGGETFLKASPPLAFLASFSQKGGGGCRGGVSTCFMLSISSPSIRYISLT